MWPATCGPGWSRSPMRPSLTASPSTGRARSMKRRLPSCGVALVADVYIGVDIGGTFTDLVLAEDGSDRLHNVKTLTTPANPVEGVMTAVREALADVGRS